MLRRRREQWKVGTERYPDVGLLLTLELQNRRSSRARRGRLVALYQMEEVYDILHICRNTGVRWDISEHNSFVVLELLQKALLREYEEMQCIEVISYAPSCMLFRKMSCYPMSLKDQDLLFLLQSSNVF